MTHPTTRFQQHDPAPVVMHEHGWHVESRHSTSEGQVVYVRCGACGTRRVDLQEHDLLPPLAISHELHPPASTPGAD